MRPRNSLRKSSFRRLGVCEQLEDRAMLSAHGLGFGPSLQQFESHLSQSPDCGSCFACDSISDQRT